MSRKKKEEKVKKSKDVELWGEFTEYCTGIRCTPDIDNFIKWIDGKLDPEINKEEFNDWEDFKSIVGK